MPFPTEQFTFKVDVPGLINLMGTSLYSEPSVAIRELIQNAHDGIIRRRMKDIHYQGEIRFRLDPENSQLQIEDDGIGLTKEEAKQYLGTLGIGLTGIMRRQSEENRSNDINGLIGQFGIGLLSAFLLSDEIEVDTLKADGNSEPVHWLASSSTAIHLEKGTKTFPGTVITLRLKPEYAVYAESEEILEKAIQKYADFLNVPIYINDHTQHVNLMEPVWFDPEADEDRLIADLDTRFNELPLCVIPIRKENPVGILGSLYISPERIPGFTSEAKLVVTIRRMIISHNIQGLVPQWAPFIRGVLELTDCKPTTSREDLVRNDEFVKVQEIIQEELFTFFERLVKTKPNIWQSLLSWHRYMLTGAATDNKRLRKILRSTYLFSTSRGRLSFEAITGNTAPKEVNDRYVKIIWYHTDRRQESALDTYFKGFRSPCVHATSTFEEMLLHQMSLDMEVEKGELVECRIASPGVKDFSSTILGALELQEADEEWQTFLESIDCRIYTAVCESPQPVFAFLNERLDLIRTIDALKKESVIPLSFQRMIENHLGDEELPRNEILLNLSHPLIQRGLERGPASLMAAVVRILVFQAMQTAGGQLTRESQDILQHDLMKIADVL